MIDALSTWPWCVANNPPEPPETARPPPRTPMRETAAIVAALHGMTVADLKDRSRARRVSWPRQEAMALMRADGWSNLQAARFFGLKDHTSANHAVKAVAARRALAQQEAA